MLAIHFKSKIQFTIQHLHSLGASSKVRFYILLIPLTLNSPGWVCYVSCCVLRLESPISYMSRLSFFLAQYACKFQTRDIFMAMAADLRR